MSEVVPPDLRGGLVTIHALLLILGYASASWTSVGFYFCESANGNEWRPPLAIQAVWPLLLLCGLYWVLESPRWLATNHCIEEAQAILNRLHSDKSDPENSFARTELYQIQKQIAMDRTLDSSWKQMFTKPSYRKRAFLAMGTTAIIQCSGVLVINSNVIFSLL